MDQMTPENVTPEMIKQLFDNAFIECELDGDAVRVQGKYKYSVFLSNGNRFVRFTCNIRTKDSADPIECMQACQKVNQEMIVMRLTPIADHNGVTLDWYVPLVGGLSPKCFVMSYREYDELVVDALARAQDIFD